MTAFYNEINPYAAVWLRNLIAAGEIPEGDVDERSIEDIEAAELEAYTQVHLFAGIGGWPYALRLAGWPDEAPVWTGSCPCQPLSSAGKRQGETDKRHLWPAFYRHISQCRPATIFGEQVASTDGREWYAAVRLDLEDLGYACGAADLAAASVGAPHIRQRLFWVGHSESLARNGERFGEASNPAQQQTRRHGLWAKHDQLVDADSQGSQRRRIGPLEHADQFTPWSSSELVPCADGKTRVTQPGLCPLADGVPNRVGRLRAYGNAIIPALAAEFVTAFMEARQE